MTKVIIFTNDNGGVSICHPSGELPIEEVLAKDCPAGAIIVNDADLPVDYFDAWELANGKVKVSLAKSVEITKKRLRILRDPLLQAQDVAFQRAMEEGKDTKEIVAEKQRLRDITKLADQATTLDKLREIKL